jgi:mRNA interferase RelE/StbE
VGTEPRILITRRAQKDLDKLESSTARRVLLRLREIKALPVAGAKALRDSRLGSYRLRVGDYRIIFDLEGSDIVVLRIGHRRDIY